MSPNMLVRAFFVALKNSLTKRALRVHREKKVKTPRHRLNSHSESVYVWALLEQAYGLKTSQEIRQNAANERGDRSRVNGYLTVEMILSQGKVSA